MKERIGYLDSIKGFSIFLVVFCHYVVLPKETVLGNIMMSMAWGAVPCFMMVSGGLLHQASEFTWKKHIKKIFKVYVTLFVWRLIYLLVFLSFSDTIVLLSDIFQYLFLFRDIEYVNTGVMWYMIAYLVALFIYPVTYYLFRTGDDGRKILFYIMILLFIGGILIISCDTILEIVLKLLNFNKVSIGGLNKIMPFTNYANMLFYFVLGAFLIEYRHVIKDKLSRNRMISGVLVITGLLGLLLIKFGTTNSFLWNGIYITNGYSHIATVVLSLGIYFVFMLNGENYINRNIGRYIGKYTMGIYYMHYLLLAICNQYLFSHLYEYYSFGLNLLKAVICCFVCTLLTVFMSKIPIIREIVK